jgi:pyrroline-5-carboxylate reductase
MTIGVIGTGNMGAALVRGWSRAFGDQGRLLVWDTVPGAMEAVASLAGVAAVRSVEQLVEEADVIVVVVKPKDGTALLRSLASLFRAGQVVVSSMAGVEIRQIRQASGWKPAVFRVMPNLGVALGAGMVGVSGEPGQPARIGRQVDELFAALGVAIEVEEPMLDTVTALSGTGPALLALVLEGVEDGGVAAGLTRSSARLFARSALLGAARLMVANEQEAGCPGEQSLPDDLSLRTGLAILEERHVGEAFREAVTTAAQRAREMRSPSGGRV